MTFVRRICLVAWWLCLSAALTGVPVVSAAEHPQKEKYAYIIGASVSMGFNIFGRGYSPPLYALKQLGYPRDRIIKKTVVTGSFRRNFRWLKRKFETHPPSIVLGVDLFHHDVRQKQDISPKTYTYIDDMLKVLTTAGTPVIVGNTWTRYDNRATIDALNEYLESKQAEYPTLHFFPVYQIYDALTADDSSYRYEVDDVSIKLTKNLRGKLFLDVVHPNDRGARIFANMILKIINTKIGDSAPYYAVDDVVRLANRR